MPWAARSSSCSRPAATTRRRSDREHGRCVLGTVKDKFLERLPNLTIAEAVGSTETGYNGATVIVKGTVNSPGMPTCAWAPTPSCSTTTTTSCSPDQVWSGRSARGNVPLRYHKDPEKSAATFVDVDGKRFAVSGDFAMVEEDGAMKLLGRGSVCINSGGEKIFPEEVEAVVKAHPGLRRGGGRSTRRALG